MRFAMASALAALILLPAASTAMADAYEGSWAAEKSWCGKTDDCTPMKITKSALQAYESKCKISDVEPLGIGKSWRWSLTCSSHGTEYTSAEIVLVTPGGEIVRYDQDGSVWQGVRCD